ncbi:hypothetical protein PtB15_12B599 [Puccinia triticina]|nr:hypothetical protein PtB15_12B599 [Puccinia triticina]
MEERQKAIAAANKQPSVQLPAPHQSAASYKTPSRRPAADLQNCEENEDRTSNDDSSNGEDLANPTQNQDKLLKE